MYFFHNIPDVSGFQVTHWSCTVAIIGTWVNKLFLFIYLRILLSPQTQPAKWLWTVPSVKAGVLFWIHWNSFPPLVVLSRFQTELSYDFLEVHDGPNLLSPMIGSFNGTQVPQFLFSSSNFLYLLFTTDNSRSNSGFKIFYEGKSLSRCWLTAWFTIWMQSLLGENTVGSESFCSDAKIMQFKARDKGRWLQSLLCYGDRAKCPD